MNQEIKNSIKWLSIVSTIKDGFDFTYFARFALKHYSVDVAERYLQMAESSYRSAKRRIEK